MNNREAIEILKKDDIGEPENGEAVVYAIQVLKRVDEGKIRKIINSPEFCPDCDNSGRTMPNGDICEFCYRNPKSVFNLAETITSYLLEGRE